MFLVNQGKVIWTYSTGRLGIRRHLADVPMQHPVLAPEWAGEVTPQKKLVWRLDAPQELNPYGPTARLEKVS